jgi:electron transport complex protein RnfG
MNALPVVGQPARPRPWHLIRAMVGIGLLCGLLIVLAYLGTFSVIERNKAEALQRAIFQVLPDARSTAAYRFTEDGFEALGDGAAEGLVVYAGYDGARLVGLAVEARGMGYQDVISILYGYSFERDAIVGIRVLASKETPGLGDKIETDPDFLRNFERLAVTLTDDGSEVAHPIVAVKHGAKKNDWEVDGITGATISSVAIADMLRESTRIWIPRIRRHLDDFRKEG